MVRAIHFTLATEASEHTQNGQKISIVLWQNVGINMNTRGATMQSLPVNIFYSYMDTL